MTEEKFRKASQIKQEIVSLKMHMDAVIKYKSFATNHQAHSLSVHSTSTEKGIKLVDFKGVLTSKDMVQIAEVAERRIAKRLKKLQRAFDEL